MKLCLQIVCFLEQQLMKIYSQLRLKMIHHAYHARNVRIKYMYLHACYLAEFTNAYQININPCYLVLYITLLGRNHL